MTARDHPGWYGAVMSTAPMAVLLHLQAVTWGLPALDWVAVGFLLLATGLAVWLLPRYATRLRGGGGLAAEVADPARGPLLATLPAGVLLLGSAWGFTGGLLVPGPVALAVDVVLMAVGAVLAVVIGVAWLTALRGRRHRLADVNGAWLVPGVMNLAVPLGLAPVIETWPAAAPELLFAGYAFLGVGLLLWLALHPLLIARLALRPAAPSELAPTQWIPLAPAGLVGLVLVRLTEATVAVGYADASLRVLAVAVAAACLGFGYWWAAYAITDLRAARRVGRLPVHPGWWAFVFPVVAIALSTATVAQVTGSSGLSAFGALLTAVCLAAWATVAWHTARPAPATVSA